MKMTKNWKRFWTLDRHHAEGFTLVELIVVIAILAILAGVAVPAYSGYITEANKTADRQLVRDVENALMMGYYQGYIDQSGMVTLSKDAPVLTDNITAADDAMLKSLHAALTAAFGSSYNDTLRLKGDWKGDVASVYTAFVNSSFGGREDALLKDVQVLTGQVADFLQENGTELMKYVGDADAWETFVQKHNVNTADTNEVANSTAMYVAQLTMDGMNEDKFVAAWNTMRDYTDFTNENSGVNMMALEAMAAHYARCEALAQFIDSNKTAQGWTPDIGEYESMTAWFSGQGGVDSEDPIGSLLSLTNKFMTAMGGDAQAVGALYLSTNTGTKDAKAYLAMMGAINDNSDKLMEGKGEANLYDGGMANDLLHSYLAAGKAMSGVDIEAGKVAVVITIENGRCTVVTLGMNEK